MSGAGLSGPFQPQLEPAPPVRGMRTETSTVPKAASGHHNTSSRRTAANGSTVTASPASHRAGTIVVIGRKWRSWRWETSSVRTAKITSDELVWELSPAGADGDQPRSAGRALVRSRTRDPVLRMAPSFLGGGGSATGLSLYSPPANWRNIPTCKAAASIHIPPNRCIFPLSLFIFLLVAPTCLPSCAFFFFFFSFLIPSKPRRHKAACLPSSLRPSSLQQPSSGSEWAESDSAAPQPAAAAPAPAPPRRPPRLLASLPPSVGRQRGRLANQSN